MIAYTNFLVCNATTNQTYEINMFLKNVQEAFPFEADELNAVY